jgi:hypothetical protein
MEDTRMALCNDEEFVASRVLTAHEQAFYAEVRGGHAFLKRATPEARAYYYADLAARIAAMIDAGTSRRRLGECLRHLAAYGGQLEPAKARNHRA